MARKYIKNKYRNRENINSRLSKKNKIQEKYSINDVITYKIPVRGQGMKETTYRVGDLPKTKKEASNKNIPLFFPNIECKNSHLAPYYTSQNQCIVCASYNSKKSDKKNKRIYNRIKYFSLEQKLIELMKASRARSYQYDTNLLDYNLDLNYVKKLWQKQNGKCFYLDMPMNWTDYSSKKYHYENKTFQLENFEYLDDDKIKMHDHMIVSFDKIEPKKGYTKNNVVLVSRVANYMKHDLDIMNFNNFSKIIGEQNLKKKISKTLSKVSNIKINENLFVGINYTEAKLLRTVNFIGNAIIETVNKLDKNMLIEDNIYSVIELSKEISKYKFNKNADKFLSGYKFFKSKNLSDRTDGIRYSIYWLFREERIVNNYKIKLLPTMKKRTKRYLSVKKIK